MGTFVRTKRVSDPIDDRVRARLIGRTSSSSSSVSDEDDLPSLSQLVHSFLQEDCDGVSVIRPGDESDTDWTSSVSDSTNMIHKVLERCGVSDASDSYRNTLQDHVFKALEVFMFPAGQLGKAVLRQNVVLFLQRTGHNAGVCTTKWKSSGSLTAGHYEFIDVINQKGSGVHGRYFIDLDFSSQFEIARATSEYLSLLKLLPRVFIGQDEDLKTIVKATSKTAKISLKSRGLSVPPWRKSRYMLNKWFWPCVRIVNPAPVTNLDPVNDNGSVPCRLVGFNDAINNRLVVHTT